MLVSIPRNPEKLENRLSPSGCGPMKFTARSRGAEIRLPDDNADVTIFRLKRIFPCAHVAGVIRE